MLTKINIKTLTFNSAGLAACAPLSQTAFIYVYGYRQI